MKPELEEKKERLDKAWEERMKKLSGGKGIPFDLIKFRANIARLRAWNRISDAADAAFLHIVKEVCGDVGLELKNWDKYKGSYEFHFVNGMVFKP